MVPATTEKGSARERLLAAANELFYDEGVQTVGIDRVIEHAGVAKASLYNTFGSKEALVCAYLENQHASTEARIKAVLARYEAPREQLLAVFEAQAELFATPGFRGCAFVSASAEAPPGGGIQQAADNYRVWLRRLFTDLATQTGVKNPKELAAELQLLYDGAGLSVRMDRSADAAVAARAAATVLIDAALTTSPARDRTRTKVRRRR
jgi:AcrR family transcriptional regulator